MKVIICVNHNELMEPNSEMSNYVVCQKCKVHGDYPIWFPLKLAKKLGTWKSKWSSYTRSGWKWERDS